MSDLPIRINAYLAREGYATRRGADALIEKGLVLVNGKRAALGDKIQKGDTVEVRGAKRSYRYIAYHKPRGIITHSPQGSQKDIATVSGLSDVFPMGRLDKASHGLIILTDDGRVTNRLLSPRFEHEKEYRVKTVQKLRPSFASRMQKGVDIGGYTTKPCTVRILGEKYFSITLSEGKKHQIRRMCSALHVDIEDLQRVRVMNIPLGNLRAGEHREFAASERMAFLKRLGLS